MLVMTVIVKALALLQWQSLPSPAVCANTFLRGLETEVCRVRCAEIKASL